MMNSDWQNIVVTLLVLAAAITVLRRLLHFLQGTPTQGCGSCQGCGSTSPSSSPSPNSQPLITLDLTPQQPKPNIGKTAHKVEK